MGAVSETALAAASTSMATCRRRCAAVGTWEGVRALVWLEKDRVVGGEDGSGRDRYVEVVGRGDVLPGLERTTRRPVVG